MKTERLDEGDEIELLQQQIDTLRLEVHNANQRIQQLEQREQQKKQCKPRRAKKKDSFHIGDIVRVTNTRGGRYGVVGEVIKIGTAQYTIKPTDGSKTLRRWPDHLELIASREN